MGLFFAWPNELKHGADGLALTFVLPAEDCNLACSFCAIRQRKEAVGRLLQPADYADFLDGVLDEIPTTIVAIQGYEPLLPEAWPYTSAILNAAARRGVRASLITNGILLADRAADLAAQRPAGLTVSLDAGRADVHDRIRGRAGAFEATLDGLRAFLRIKPAETRVSVNSVMLPRRRSHLDSLPEVLAELGVANWTVTPVLRIGRGGLGGPLEDDCSILDNLHALKARAAHFGIEVALYDELGQIADGTLDLGGLAAHVFDRPDGLVRLGPTGACSVGREILQEVGPATAVWRPGEEAPGAFVRRLLPTDLAWASRAA